LENGVFRSRKSKENRQYNGQTKTEKRNTTIYKRLHRKIKIEQYESHNKPDMNSGISDWEAMSASLVDDDYDES
jgi:hypothetical protein